MNFAFHIPRLRPAHRNAGAFQKMERDYVSGLRRTWILLLATPALGLLLALTNVLLQRPLYEAAGELQLEHGAVASDNVKRYGKHIFDNEIVLLSTDSFRRSVLDELPEPDRAQLLHAKPGTAKGVKAGEDPNAVPTRLFRGIKIRREPETSLLRVSCINGNPRLAADAVNATIQAATQANRRLALQRAVTIRDFTTGAIDALRVKIREEEAEEDAGRPDAAATFAVQQARTLSFSSRPFNRRRVRKQLRAGGLRQSQKSSHYTFTLSDLDSSLPALDKAATAARLNQIEAEARLKLLESAGMEQRQAFPEAIQSSELERLRQDLNQATAQYRFMAANLGPGQPEMQGRLASIHELQLSLAALDREQTVRAQGRVAEARARTQALDAAAATERARVLRLIHTEESSAILEINLAVNLTLLDDLTHRLESYPIDAGLNAPYLDVLELAQVPGRPIQVSLAAPLILGSGTGLLLGALAALFFFFRSTERWTVEEVEERMERPVLALLNRVDSAAERPAVAGATQLTTLYKALEEPLSGLRDQLQFFATDQPCPVILLTSSQPGEGRTTLAAAFASVLARTAGPVLLIDADMRRPTLHRQFQMPGHVGLSQVLSGQATFESVVQQVDLAGVTHAGSIGEHGPATLDVLVAGPPPADRFEALHSVAMSSLLEQARARYRFIVIDSSPASQGNILTAEGEVNATFLVARYGWVGLRALQASGVWLERAGLPLSGVIVNGVPA